MIKVIVDEKIYKFLEEREETLLYVVLAPSLIGKAAIFGGSIWIIEGDAVFCYDSEGGLGYDAEFTEWLKKFYPEVFI